MDSSKTEKKIVFIGNEKVGKTQIIKRIVFESFTETVYFRKLIKQVLSCYRSRIRIKDRKRKKYRG